MMQQPTRRAGYEGIAAFYDFLFGPVNRPLNRAGAALGRPRSGMHILDVCCGTGTYLESFLGLECNLFGLDASPQMLAVAYRRLGNGAHLDRGDAIHLPYAPGVFDLVSCKLALHEMTGEVRASLMGEARRVLRPDGRIVLIDFHPGPYELLKGWITRAVVLVVEFIAGREHLRNHLQFMASGGLRALAQGHSLQLEKQVLLGGGNFAVLALVETDPGTKASSDPVVE